MNFLSFCGLLYEIFFASSPNLKRIRRKGLLAIKIGQLYALRADFIGLHRANQLSNLYEKNFEDIQSPSSEHFDNNFKKNFDTIDTFAFSEASIGRVFGGKKAGKSIVIKTVKEDFRPKFLRDVSRLKKYFRVFIFLYPKLARVADPIGTLEDLERMTLSELDLRNEILGAQTLENILSKHKKFLNNTIYHELRFPKIYEKISSSGILVSERIWGSSFQELLEKGALPYQALLDFFFQHIFCMLQDGHFHEDIHSGNIFLDQNIIYLLDNGSIGYASEKLRHGLTNFFYSLSHNDIASAGLSLTSMAKNTEENKKNFKKFSQTFFDLYKDFYYKKLSEISLTQQMMASIKLAVHAGYVFERGMYPIIKSFMYLDGMARACNPDTRLMQDVRPLIEKYIEYRKQQNS